MINTRDNLSRRDVLKKAGEAAVVSALAGVAVPLVHAGETHTIQLALVGCGGRGTGAAQNALSTKIGPTKLVAMADIFPDHLSKSHHSLQSHQDEMAGHVEVPEAHRFIGFDAYRKAMDCLHPGDVVILATPPAFRWVHFTYAIHKGLNVFMEKPVAVDSGSARKMFRLGEESRARNLKVGVGLMCRHCAARQELYKRIKDGQLGDIQLLRAYRQRGPEAKEFAPRKPEGISELLYQIKWFHSFLWASGGCYSDFLIHNIDECCWMKDAWPIKAQAAGGRHFRGSHIDQNFDHYSVEYTFADGAKLFLEGRNIRNCHNEFASYATGTKCSATISTAAHTPAACRIYKNHNFAKKDTVWKFRDDEPNPYQLEWDHLMEAIRQDKPHNEVKRGTEASLVTAMGRRAAHTGQAVTWDDMLRDDHEFAPDVDKLTLDSAAPVRADNEGKYPVPKPGITKKAEY